MFSGYFSLRLISWLIYVVDTFIDHSLCCCIVLHSRDSLLFSIYMSMGILIASSCWLFPIQFLWMFVCKSCHVPCFCFSQRMVKTGAWHGIWDYLCFSETVKIISKLAIQLYLHLDCGEILSLWTVVTDCQESWGTHGEVGNEEPPKPRQRITGNSGMLRVGEIVSANEETPAINYPIASGQSWNHIHVSNIIQNHQIVFVYLE